MLNEMWSKSQIIDYYSNHDIDKNSVIQKFCVDDNKLMGIAFSMCSIIVSTFEKNNIRFQTNPSQKQQLLAVKKDGFNIQYLENPNIEVCITALYANPKAIPFMDIVRWPELYNLYVLLMR